MYFRLFVVAVVVMCASHTIAKEKIFEGLRERLGGKRTFLGQLVSCPYCNSHWISFAMVPLTALYVFPLRPELDATFAQPGVSALGTIAWALRWFLSAIFLTACAAFLRIGFYFVDEGQGLLRREIEKTEAETEVVEKIADAPDVEVDVDAGDAKDD